MNDLNDFFKAFAEAKAKDPKTKIVSEVKESIKEDLPNLFSALIKASSVEQSKEEKLQVVEIQPTKIAEEKPLEQPRTPEQAQDGVEKYLSALPSTSHSFQQPLEQPVSQEIKDITNKIKYMEQWLGKIAATGPGSGEVNFRWLDDVNRSTMTQSNDNWVLEYDAATKKVQFTENIGPIRTVKFNTLGPLQDLIPGQVAWNTAEDCLDIRHADGSTLQTGLEQHMQVYNGSDSPMVSGTVVRFAGVNGEGDETPIVLPNIGNGTIPPLYTVGVVTTDIQPGGLGRATTFGKVRNTNTTGSDVGETWVKGDILYLSPTNPGKYTKFKPTAPNIVVVVAAVLKVDATNGILLVRPTIFPRLFYGSFADTTNQTHTLTNTPKSVTFNSTEIANGHRRGTDTSHIIAENSGLYNYKFSMQLVSTNSAAKEVWIWFRKNGVDIPNSATRKTIVGNTVYDVAAWDITVSMLPNDYFQIMWAVSDPAVSITAPPATAFCPAIPSVLLTISEIAL